MRSKIRHIQHFLTLVVIICLGYLSWYQWDSIRETEKNRVLQEIVWQTPGTSWQEEQTEENGAGEAAAQADARPDADQSQDDEAESQRDSSFVAGFAELAKLNSDLKAWISIPDTPVSFPVVQTKDNSYYLNHDFYGDLDRHGTIFVDCSADLEGGELNVIIYGHNMRDDTMFGSLKRYRQEDYYKEHPSFFLSLPDGMQEYEILAVLENDIFSGAEDTFQYYEYRHITDEEMYETYCRDVRERSIYDTGVEAEYMDQLVTLCTCSYGSLEQRLLIVGRLKQEELE